MSRMGTSGHRLAGLLLKHAAWISPPARKEWLRAMHNELEHLPRAAAALSWALGCALVSYRERFFVMVGSLNNVARWLLSIEMAVCLVPLTWLFVAVFALTAHGTMPLRLGILAGSGALLGPVGLLVGLRIILVSRGSLGKATTTVIVVLTVWTVVAYSGQIIHNGTPFAEVWREFILIAVLPAWAVAHLLRINAARRASAGIA